MGILCTGHGGVYNALMTHVRNFILGVSLVALLTAPNAMAQSTYQVRQGRLLSLAEILGGVHYLRSTCYQRESQTWRQQMTQLIRIEQPSQEFRAQMVTRFNSAYKQQERRFPKCNKQAKQEASRLAIQGQTLAEQLLRTMS